MKLYAYIFCSITILFFACAKKEEINNSDTRVGISKVTFFPTIETVGEHLIILQEGETYTDEGATAILNGAEAEYVTTSDVDFDNPGIYNIDYSITNEDGFSVSDWRTVVVIGSDVSTNDFSGTYERFIDGESNDQHPIVTKTANGVYTVQNPGGAVDADDIIAIAVNVTGNEFNIPRQLLPGLGAFSTNGGEYFPGSVPEYHWAIVNGGYGPQERVFIKN